MVMIIKLRDERTLPEIYAQLMSDIVACSNMIDPDNWEDNWKDNWEDQGDLMSELEDMSQEIETLEEVMQLKKPVYCMCFDYPEHPGRTQ